MALYVVVANRTLAAGALAAHLREVLAADDAASFRVVAPVAIPNVAAFEIGGAMGGIAVVDVDGRERAYDDAQRRVDELVGWLRSAGAPATGEVIAGDPVVAVGQIVAVGEVAEVIVSTLPSRLSRWLRQDLPQRLRRRVDVAVRVIEAHDDVLPEPPLVVDDEPDAAGRPAEQDRGSMTERVYKIIELVGTSTESWEKAAAAAVKTAQQSIRDLRVAEVVQLDLVVGDGDVTVYRAKVKVSFKYERSE